MKIKFDFITNSSSSSFVAYGIEMPCVEDFPDSIFLLAFEKHFEKLESKKENPNWDRWYKEEYTKMASLDSNEEKIAHMKEDRWEDEPAELLGIFGLSVGGYDYSNNYVGFEISNIDKVFPETRVKDLKFDVAKKLSVIFEKEFNEKDVSYIEEVWYNG